MATQDRIGGIVKKRDANLMNRDFTRIISEIRKARHRALQSVNKELVLLYWNVGKQISEKLKSAQWGG